MQSTKSTINEVELLTLATVAVSNVASLTVTPECPWYVHTLLTPVVAVVLVDRTLVNVWLDERNGRCTQVKAKIV